jgi:hypothetical protein
LTTGVNLLRLEQGIQRGTSLEITVDGEPVKAYSGETLATVLLCMDSRMIRTTSKSAEPQGLYCGRGVCKDIRRKGGKRGSNLQDRW